MTVYTIMYDGKCEEAYSMKEFRALFAGDLCQAAIKEQGYAMCLKENEKSRRHGWIKQRRKNYPVYGFDIHWDETERMVDGAYGN